jgi:glycosyltransferase involved in cell wall biosynthesis
MRRLPPTFSVIVPFFNAAPYIRACLEGLLNQSVPADDCEILMQDNNSSDGSAAIVRECLSEAAPGWRETSCARCATSPRASGRQALRHGNCPQSRSSPWPTMGCSSALRSQPSRAAAG